MDFFKQHKILTSVLLVIVLFIGYSMLTGGEGEEDLLTSETVTEQTPAAVAEEEVVSLLFELQSLSLNKDLLGSDLFRGLIDFSQELAPQPVGRSNPFAPIGQ